MNHADRAEALFREGYNCAQAVLCAFSDITGLEHDTAARLGSSFGGGLARMREVCGAVSGAAMVLGLLRGYTDPGDSEAKRRHYALVQELAARFRAENGSIICRELLHSSGASGGFIPEERTPQYYAKRPCPALVRQAAQIVEELLRESG